MAASVIIQLDTFNIPTGSRFDLCDGHRSNMNGLKLMAKAEHGSLKPSRINWPASLALLQSIVCANTTQNQGNAAL